MKITVSKVSAIVFTVIAVAAFAWMTMRPSIDAQAAGFGLASKSASANTTTAPSKDTDASSESETTNEDSTTDSMTEEKDTKKSEKESDDKVEEKAEEKSADDKTPDDAKQDTDSSVDTVKPSADDASVKQSDEEQSAKPITPEAPTAPTAPTSPAAPPTSDNTNDQTDNKKKTDTEKESAERASQADGVKATDSTAKTEESDQKSKSVIVATAAVETTTAVVAQDKQQTETDEANSSNIYTQADNARGTVVILSGCDYKPNVEGGIVTTLHKSLPQKGWNTLSFQLPNLSSTSTFKDLEAVMPEATKNIESSIAMAKEKSDTPVTLLAHGCGSQMALAWMEVKGNNSIDAYIGLGTGIMNSDAKDTDHLRLPLEAMKFPQLDIFGSADHAAVLKTAPERLGHINRASNPASRQKIILDADHNMTGKEDVLARVIAKWLDKKAFKK